MILSYKIRLLPTPEQENLLWQSVNAARFIWNWGLAYQMDLFKNGEKRLSGYDMKKVLTQLKKQEEYSWLNQVSSQTLNMALLDLDGAYKKFFTIQKHGQKFSKFAKRFTPYDMLGHPKFKKKAKSKPSFYTRHDSIYIMQTAVNIEKIGKVKYQTNYKLPVVSKKALNTAKFTNPRVSFVNKKWILSFGIECENQAQKAPPKLNDFAIGIDLGIKSLATISYNGNYRHFKNINKTYKVRKLKKRLKHQQRKLSRQFLTNGKGFAANYNKTNNILKTQAKINNLYRQLANIRLNYIHHITHEITNLLPKAIAVEDLNIQGMMKNRHLAQSIQEQLLHEFLRQIEYKCWHKGIELIKADRFYPSSKKCSKCGHIKRNLKLKDRNYKCDNTDCNNTMDRDQNAASNLEKLVA
jgi:putative transposase